VDRFTEAADILAGFATLDERTRTEQPGQRARQFGDAPVFARVEELAV
jgi:hypothetical protein